MPTRRTAVPSLLALVASFAMLCPLALAAGTVAPLPASDYAVRSACSQPAPGSAGCLALQLVPRTAQARAHTHPLGITRPAPSQAHTPAEGYFGLRPQDLHAAYQLPSTSASAQTIALVDAYNDPSAAADLEVYDEEFGLPACTTGNECFKQVNQNGEASKLPYPKTTLQLEEGLAKGSAEAEEAAGWGFEISLDIEVAHATCQNCHIVLVEASSPTDGNLDAAEQAAVTLGASEISNSWGGPELGAATIASSFEHPGVVITASAGDDGYLSWDARESAQRGYAEFPASSPDVIAVGGTRLSLGAGSEWAGETVWDGDGAGGGGCSIEFEAQPWQQGVSDWSTVGCAKKRAVADVAADADPYTGVAIYDATAKCEYEEAGKVLLGQWCTVGGTSLASPLIASTFALAGGAHGVAYPARTLYENDLAAPGSLHDVTSGSNGKCSEFDPQTGLSKCEPSAEAAESCASKLICLAAAGYDGPTGVGTPDGIAAFEPPTEGPGETPTEGPGEAPTEGQGGPPKEGPSEAGGGGHTAHLPGGTAGGFLETSAGAGGSSEPTAGAAASGPATVQLSGLALTLRAILALNRNRPKASQVGFTFTITAAARVRVTLARRARSHGRTRWQNVRGALTINAASGRNSRHLLGAGTLAPGLYRLTLRPLHASARSIEFAIG